MAKAMLEPNACLQACGSPGGPGQGMVPPSIADALSPTAAQEASLCGEGGEAAAGADAAAGSLREEGADGAAAAHTPGAGAGLAADAAGEDGVVCAGPQHGAFGVAFKEGRLLAALPGATLLLGSGLWALHLSLSFGWDCGCPITGSVQGQVGWGFEPPDLVEGVPAHGRGVGLR